jgi:CHAT domain-containing protein
MIQPTTIIACLLTLQSSAKIQDKPYVGPKPHPEVQKLLNQWDRDEQSARERFQLASEALAIAVGQNDVYGQGYALFFCGMAQRDLNNHEKAIIFGVRSLEIIRSYRDKLLEPALANLVGEELITVKRPQDAIKFLRTAASIYTRDNAVGLAAEVKRKIAIALRDVGKDKAAISQLNDVIRDFQLLKSESETATTLLLKAELNLKIGESEEALHNYTDTLQYYERSNNVMGKSDALYGLSRVYQAKRLLPLAICFGKRAIEQSQNLRKPTKLSNQEWIESYTRSVEPRYRFLANLLVEQGRIIEAQQVLDLLKDQEQFKLLNQRRLDQEKVNLTPLEIQWVRDYQKLGKALAECASEKKSIEDDSHGLRTDVQKARLVELDIELEKASRAFQSFLKSVETAFKSYDVSKERLVDLSTSQALGRTLNKLPGYAAIYTLVTEDHVRTLLTVPNARIVAQAPNKFNFKDLSAKILEFRAQVQNPASDPRELGAELYDLLIRPLEPSLKASGTKQIIWSLDSVLRYVPIWALYDKESKQYLVEKYPSSLFTPRTVDRLAEPGKTLSTASAFGVTESATLKTLSGSVSFAALSGTRAELETLRTVFGARPKLDADFTEQSFKEGFGSDVVHVATHFRLVPGNEFESVLLMGKSTGLSLSRFKELPSDCMSNVDLLVLSACDTGVGTPNADGSEFEGLALLAQQKGAGAVMASLWPVNDDATSKLMGDFYTFRMNHPEWTKVEALREAQLRMIRGENKPGENWSPPRGPNTPETNAPKWPKTEPAYKHPYFWAPFVITGNVK